MRLPSDLSLRDAVEDDLPAIAELRAAVGWGVQDWALRAVIGSADARCVVVVDRDGRLAGVGSGIVYGPLGFVGNMIVATPHRRRGVGSVILDEVVAFLEAAGCWRLELNATSDGRPLYERHGFVPSGTQLSAQLPRSAPAEPDRGVRIRDLGTDDLEQLAAYDRPRFGGDRSRLLSMMLADPGRPLLAAERDGELAGYGWLRADGARLGPLVAESPAIAAGLLRAAFDRDPGLETLQLSVPSENVAGVSWLRSLGLEPDPWDGRMGRGPSIARRPETVYAIVVGALG